MPTYKIIKQEYYKVPYRDTYLIEADSLDEAIQDFECGEIIDTDCLHDLAEETGDYILEDEEGNILYTSNV